MTTPAADILAADLRRHDYERYLLTLFAPAARRPSLWAILAFNLELARIPDSVSQPVLGQMRLAWWREAVEKALDRHDIGGNPVLAQLVAAHRDGAIDRDALAALIDARERDALREADAPLAEIERDSGDVGDALARLRLHALGLDQSDGAFGRHQGIASALVGRLKRSARAAAIGQLAIPSDLVPILDAKIDLDTASPRAVLLQFTVLLVAAIERHLHDARSKNQTPRVAFPALGDGVIAARYLRRLRRVGGDPADPRLALTDGLAPWSLGWAWARGRI